tara:strand:- start:33428 stop:34207 length:780 start_codon:yes stop_codon:yes gene_type:complete
MKKEKLYFYLTGNWYKGDMPNFYDVTDFESTKLLEKNYSAIKEEILNFYERDALSFKANFTPYKYKEQGWQTINLISFMLKRQSNIKKFPVLFDAVSKIPDLLTIQIAVLKPQTRVKAHFGDTNAIIRSHLGIVVPGTLPDIGFRNGTEEKCWEEGRVLAICVAHRHYVWNNTDKTRIILLVDTIHPDFRAEKTWICSGLLSAAFLKLIATKLPVTKKTPHFIVRLFHSILSVFFRLTLFLQDCLNWLVSIVFGKSKYE